jgi:GT2 family glycosyltransferase
MNPFETQSNIQSKVAVLVLNFNGKRHLSKCFSSLKEQVYGDFQVYLVDNCSTDGSVEYTKHNYAFVKIIQFRKNLGFAKAYNEAIKMVETDFVVLLNNDTCVDKYWLAELMDSVMEDKTIAAVGSKLLLMDRPDFLHNAGAKITPIGSGFDIGFGEKDSKQYNVKKEVGAVCGGSMLVPKKFFADRWV